VYPQPVPVAVYPPAQPIPIIIQPQPIPPPLLTQHSSYITSTQPYYPTVPYPNQPVLQRAPTSFHLGPAAEAPASPVRDYRRQRTYSYPRGGDRGQYRRDSREFAQSIRSPNDRLEGERYSTGEDRQPRYVEVNKERRNTPSPHPPPRKQRSYSESGYPPETTLRVPAPPTHSKRRSFERDQPFRRELEVPRYDTERAPHHHVFPPHDRRRSHSPR